jgi:hypothetical protein
MNEHTKLLIMKAGGIICSTEGSAVIDKIDYLHFDAEKFAELLIKECAIIANRADNTETEIRCMYDVITEHFGVE